MTVYSVPSPRCLHNFYLYKVTWSTADAIASLEVGVFLTKGRLKKQAEKLKSCKMKDVECGMNV